MTISQDIKELIQEEFAKKHATIEDLPDRKTTLDIIAGTRKINKPGIKCNVKVSGTNLKSNSPRGLYRANGINITSYHKIMKNYTGNHS